MFYDQNSCSANEIYLGGKRKDMRCPGIEPGSQEWESCMIPLHQQRFVEMPGIEPGAFHMRSERSTTEPHPLVPIGGQSLKYLVGKQD